MMKKKMLIGTIALALMISAGAASALAAGPADRALCETAVCGSCGLQFVDENKDGVCDRRALDLQKESCGMKRQNNACGMVRHGKRAGQRHCDR